MFPERLSGLRYLVAGLVAAILKAVLDRLVFAGFQRPFDAWFYWWPLHVFSPWTAFTQTDWLAAAGLVAVACPFIAFGTWLTARRLRTIGWSPWWTLLFFVPAVNVAFFLVLAVGQEGGAKEETTGAGFGDAWTESRVTAVVAVAGFGASALAVAQLQSYGWGLFLGMPFAMGFATTLLLNSGSRRASRGDCARVAITAMLVTGTALLAFALEGILCLLMAAPLALILCLLGILVADFTLPASRQLTNVLIAVALLLPPVVSAAETLAAPASPLYAVSTTIEIGATPSEVWRHVIAFPDLPPPRELLFRAGIAYPLRATITGEGPGAIRRCEFSTGAFIEPIEIWQEPRLLRFAVTHNPAPMQELSPYGAIHAAHLHGFLASERGQFALEPLPGGRTRLTGTTWYRHGLWPAGYWRFWSDAILHAIHRRVLEHIARQASASAL